MDEIITRWAADLSKYQKEFQQQAETVAKWDRGLVENSDKVKQLYAKTFTAERDAAEVERQLTLMEENQAELDSYLDRYEKEVENMMRTHGVGGKSDGLRGPDQDREKTYVDLSFLDSTDDDPEHTRLICGTVINSPRNCKTGSMS
jgi:nuclear pore complex protein Nup62